MMIDLSRVGPITEIGRHVHWSSDRLADEVIGRFADLRRRGIGSGSKVVIAHGGTAAFFADLLAVWQSGACACCVSETLSRLELVTICQFVKADLVLAKAPFPNGLSVDIVDLGATQDAGVVAATDGKSYLDDPALILFTSGTTGVPKGVVHSFRSLGARLALNQAYIPVAERAVTLCPLPTHFGHGLIGNALTALLGGGHLLLPGELGATLGSVLGDIVDDHAVTFMSSVPALWKVATKMSSPPRRGSLERVHVGSAPFSASLWSQVANWAGTQRVFNMYGITETANWIGGISAEEAEPADGLVGRIWGGAVLLKDRDGTMHSVGEGEVVVCSPSLMIGYHMRPDLTADVCRDGWYHTGDTGTIDDRGILRLTGRIKHEINRAGLKVYPEDIDLLLERNDSIIDACAFAIPDDIAGELIGVAVTPARPDIFRLDDLQDWTAERITREKFPDRWFVVSEIPRTERGKINRATVASYCLSTAPAADSALDARGIVARALDLAPSAVGNDAAPGKLSKWDSLATIRVILELEKALQRSLSRGELAAAGSLLGVGRIINGSLAKSTGGRERGELDRLTSALLAAGFAEYPVIFLLPSFDYCRARGADDPEELIDMLLALLPAKANLVMGSFTWAFCRGVPYHHRDSPTEIGLINELFRRRQSVVRSQHPIYSYAAFGPDAHALMEQETRDSWGEGSVTRKLLARDDVRVIQLGIEPVRGSHLSANTGLHSLEQEAKVQYRSMKPFSCDADFGLGAKPYTATMFARDVDRCAASSWRAVDEVLRGRGLVHFRPDERIYAYNNHDLREAAREQLRNNPDVFRISPDEPLLLQVAEVTN